MSRATAIFMWCIAILAIGAWSFFAFRSISECVELDQARSWPTAQGVVISATITEHRGSKNKRTYRPVIRYTYVAGPDLAEFTGSRIHARSPSSGRSSAANAVVARYAPGTPLKVFVDPARPDNAILEPGMRSDDWLELSIFGAVLLLAIGLLATAWHFSRRLGPGYIAGMRVREGATTRVRPESCGSLAGGFFLASVLAFVGSGVGKAYGGFDAAWLAGILSSCIVVALIVWIWMQKAAASPSTADLFLDYDKELVTTPKLTGFKPEMISMSAVTGTAINAVTSTNGKTKTTVYQVHLSDAERTFGPVAAVFSVESNAKTFEAWLRQQLALSGV